MVILNISRLVSILAMACNGTRAGSLTKLFFHHFHSYLSFSLTHHLHVHNLTCHLSITKLRVAQGNYFKELSEIKCLNNRAKADPGYRPTCSLVGTLEERRDDNCDVS